MEKNSQQLWQQLAAFPFDATGAALPFSRRLARENGWSDDFAGRVVEEYRRFLFLCVTARHEICPSDEVDQAWHLHLTYTRSYWEELCRETLGQPIHHGPTRGGPAEFDKHVSMYEQTLASYREYFGSDPPPEIWPDVAARFAEGAVHQRVNRARNWIVPKPRWLTALSRRQPRQRSAVHLSAACLPLMIAVAGPWNWNGPLFIKFYGALLGAILLFHVIWRYVLSYTSDADEDSPLDPYDVACLACNRKVAVNAAVTKLTHEKKLQIRKQTDRSGGGVTGINYVFESQGAVEADALPLERAILAIANNGKTLKDLQQAASGEADKIRARLQGRSLLVRNDLSRWIRIVPGVLMTGLLVFGLSKISIGISRDKPVGFLILLSIVTAILTFVVSRRPHRTTAGSRVLRKLKRDHGALPAQVMRPSASPNEVALAAGLFGVAVLADGPLTDVYQAWKGTTLTGTGQWTSGSGGGCGGGCGAGCGGGGGCGGGCGGCGGC